jgi:hypothetical protein
LCEEEEEKRKRSGEIEEGEAYNTLDNEYYTYAETTVYTLNYLIS